MSVPGSLWTLEDLGADLEKDVGVHEISKLRRL